MNILAKQDPNNPGSIDMYLRELSLLVGHEVQNALLPQQYLVHEGAYHNPHDGADVHAKRRGDDRPRRLQDRFRWPRHQVLRGAVKVQLEPPRRGEGEYTHAGGGVDS